MNNIKVSNKFLAILCLICAIVLEGASILQSGEFFYSSADGFWGAVLVTIGGALDIGQIIFPALTVICYSKSKYIGVICFGILSIAAVTYSFGTSMGFNINKNNEIINETVTTSDAYKRQNEVFNATSSSIASTNDDLIKMKANRNQNETQIRNDYAPLIATAKKLNMLTINKDSVAEITKRRDAEIKKLDDAIKEKEDLLSVNENKLTVVNEGFSTVGTNIKTTKGIMGLAEWISPADAKNMADNLNMVKEILVCLFGIAFSMGFGILIDKKGDFEFTQSDNDYSGKTIPSLSRKYDPITAKSNIDIPNQNPNQSLDLGTSSKINNYVPDELKSKNPIGFQVPAPVKVETKKPTIKREVLQKYINAMMKNVDNNGFVDGYQKISKRALITPNDGKECRGHLINIGTIETSGVRTKLVKK